jgi:hypothetical protein
MPVDWRPADAAAQPFTADPRISMLALPDQSDLR